MYKLLAMDLDETLFNDEHKIDQRNKDLIKQAREMGIKIIPCSGRGPGFLGDLYDDLDLNYPEEYSILANGAIVLEHYTNKIIQYYNIPFEKAFELFQFGIKHGLCVQIFTPEYVYVYQYNSEEYERIKKFGNNIHFMNSFDFDLLQDQIILKVLFEKEDGMAYLHSLEPKLEKITKDHITVSYSSDRYMELNALGIHKGIGLQNLATHLNIPLDHTIGVGDNHNDFGLIKYAGVGVAVQNAIPEIKELADMITEATNNENAIAEVIESMIIKEETNVK